MMVIDAKMRISKARIALITQHPFFGSLALRLTPEQSTAIPTCATDGRVLLYNPKFIESITQEEVMGAVAHEVMHCAMGHPWRRAAREPMKWNVAGDIAINPLVRDAGLKLIKAALYPALLGLQEGEHAEGYYAKLPDQQQCQMYVQGGAGSGKGQSDPNGHGCGCSGVLDATNPDTGQPMSAAEASMAQAEWQVAVQQAAESAKAAGRLPRALERFVDNVRKPSIDWRSVLRQFITVLARDDYRWSVPNKRFVGAGIYLPSMRSERVGTLVVAVDTSGSIGQAELNAFTSELNAICEDVKPNELHALSCDTRITSHEEYQPDDYPITLNAKGGGGTYFQPVFNYVEEMGIEPQALIYLTDMYPGDSPRDPGYPVLWASTTEGRYGEFGETVYVHVEQV